MVGIMLKRQTLAVMVKPTTASVQIGVRGAAGSVWGIFFRKSFCPEFSVRLELINFPDAKFATVYKGNIIKNLIMDCQSYTKYRPNETTGGIFVSWRRKEELPTGA